MPPEWFAENARPDSLEFHEVVLKSCEGARERRYHKAEEMQADLALLQSGQSVRRLRTLEERVNRWRRIGWVAAREADLRRELEQLLEKARVEDPFQDVATSRQASDKILIVLAELGEWSKAMDWVEQGYHRRPGRLRRSGRFASFADLEFEVAQITRG